MTHTAQGNGAFKVFKDEVLKGNHDLLTDTIQVSVLDFTSAGQPNTEAVFDADGTQETQRTATDVSNAELATTPNATLASKTIGSPLAEGSFDAANVTLTDIDNNQVLDALIIWNDSSTSPTDQLVMYFDNGTGFGSATQGNDVEITWNSSGLFTTS